MTLLVGRRKGVRPVKNFEWWGAGVVICLERGADVHMAQLMPLPLTSVKSRLVLPFCYWLTQVVPHKGPLNRCMYVFQLDSFVGLMFIFVTVYIVACMSA